MADFDLAVIGGGINGTGIARDAAGRGLRVVLVEQNDLASATSSASSKLIHGGLRYLEHYEFGLVRAALKEPAELALYDDIERRRAVIERAAREGRNFTQAYAEAAQFEPAVARFFNEVFVMAELEGMTLSEISKLLKRSNQDRVFAGCAGRDAEGSSQHALYTA